MGAKQDKISDLDPIKLMDYASSQLTEFDLKIYKLNQKFASFQDQFYNYQYSIDQKIENKYNQLYEKLEKIENLISASTFNKPPDVEAAIDSNSSNKKNLNNLKENLLKKNDIINNEFILKNINYQEENNLIIKNSDSYSKANVIINNTNDQKINSIIEPILPVIIENPYYINEKILQKINIYLFGIKKENEKYFQAINENFKYIKTIDINFSLLINSIKKSEIKIENPSLVIFLSPDYRGRLPDNWTSITEYVYNYTNGNLVMVKIVDIFKKFNSDSEFSHGINKNKIDGLSIFKLTFQSSNDKIENNNDSIQIKNFLTNIKKAILERLNNI